MKRKKSNERGGSTATFIVVLLIIVLLVYAGWNYIGAVYQSQGIKQEMHTAVLQGSALPTGAGKPNPADYVKDRIKRAAVEYELPPDTYIEVKPLNNVLQARVFYKRKVSLLPFGLWNYEYVFDETVAPTGFLTKE